MPDKKEYITITELGELVGLSRQRLHQMVGEGKIKPTVKHPLFFLFDRQATAQIIKEFGRG